MKWYYMSLVIVTITITVFSAKRVTGEDLQRTPRGELIARWLILTKKDVSIYDSFKDSYLALSSGPISKEKDCKAERRRLTRNYTVLYI